MRRSWEGEEERSGHQKFEIQRDKVVAAPPIVYEGKSGDLYTPPLP